MTCARWKALSGPSASAGMAALFNAVIAGFVQAGDHVVCAEQIYGVSYAGVAASSAAFPSP